MSLITKYHDRFLKACAIKKLILRVLGEVDNLPIWYVSNQIGFKTKCPRLLMVGGMHGEEVAGPLGILAFLENFDPIVYNNINLSFIPLVNPVAYNTRRRYNDKDERSNCGFYGSERTGDNPSREGVILLKHAQLLKQSSRDGFLSLHEDIDSSKFYLYTFERSPDPTRFTYEMRDCGASFCVNGVLDNELVTADTQGTEGIMVKEGVVYRLSDGSLEHWLFTEGSQVAVVTETPGKMKLIERMTASVALIEKFIKLRS